MVVRLLAGAQRQMLHARALAFEDPRTNKTVSFTMDPPADFIAVYEQNTMENQIKTITGPNWPGVHYFSTTVAGGVSQGDWAGLNLGEHCGDDPAHVQQNRQRLNQLLPSAPHWLQQVHGTQDYQALKPASQTRDWDQAQ